MRRVLIFIFFCLVLGKSEGDTVPITLDFAQTEEDLAKGLMQVPYLEPNHGMLFCYPSPRKLSFWMYNTLIDLSIAFIDKNSIIREIHEMKSYPEIQSPSFFRTQGVTSSTDAQYALEMNKNWFANHNIKPGDRVFWNTTSGQGYIDTK